MTLSTFIRAAHRAAQEFKAGLEPAKQKSVREHKRLMACNRYAPWLETDRGSFREKCFHPTLYAVVNRQGEIGETYLFAGAANRQLTVRPLLFSSDHPSPAGKCEEDDLGKAAA